MALKTLHVIKQRLLERPIELAQARQAGFTVLGWSGDHIPEEIIYALGFIPLRIGLGGDERLAEIGTRCTSYKQCVRETVGQSLDNQDIFMRQSDVLAFDATCLQTFRTAELIRAHYKCKVLVLGLPRNFYWKEARQYYIREVEYFTQLLEEYVGVRIEEKKLIAAVELYNKIRKAIRQIYEYKALTKAVIAWEDLYDIIQAGYYLDRVEYLSLLERVLHEIREQVALTMIDEVEDEIEDEVRIFISGSVIPRGERKLVDLITNVGGRIVGDDLWSKKTPYHELVIQEITPAGIALGYLERAIHKTLPDIEIASQHRLKELKGLVESSNAQGVIYHYSDPFTSKVKEMKEMLKRRGISLLDIHTEYEGSDSGALRTRVEAFVEMIKQQNLVAAQRQVAFAEISKNMVVDEINISQ